jgi:hypothetical protein
MTPTIQIIGERTLRILKRGNLQRDKEWDFRDIEYLVRDTAAKLIKGEWMSGRADGQKELSSQYIATFTQPVLKDPYGVNYCDMPISNWIRLPNESGIASVRPDTLTLKSKKTKGYEIQAFIPVPNRFIDIYANLPAFALEGCFSWQLRKNKLYFGERWGETVLENNITNVIIDVATVDPGAISIDEPLPIGEDMISTVITEVLKILGAAESKPKDYLNDQNVNKA